MQDSRLSGPNNQDTHQGVNFVYIVGMGNIPQIRTHHISITSIKPFRENEKGRQFRPTGAIG